MVLRLGSYSYPFPISHAEKKLELRIEFPNHVIDFIDFALGNLLDLDGFREFHYSQQAQRD